MNEPTPTPPLVDVIAEAIEAHERRISQSLHQGCICGWIGKAFGFDHAAHQARAVLAALTKAGGVEWGWEYQSIIGGDHDKRITRNWGGDRPLTREEAQANVDAMNKNTKRPDVARLVSRITGPWTAVEG